MDQTTVSKYGWILITAVVVVLLIVGMRPVADGLTTQVKRIVNEDIEVYTVTLDAGEGILSQTEIKVSPGKMYGYLPTPIKEDATFLGWYTEEGVKVTSQTEYSGSSEHTLFAQWESN